MASTATRTTRSGKPAPARHGSHYELGEVALIYLVKETPEAMAGLAKLLRRTEHTIDLIWGLCDGRAFGKRVARGGQMKVKRQVEYVRKLFGEGARGSAIFSPTGLSGPIPADLL